MNEFIVGEYVERKMDNAVGVVVEIQEYDGGHVYKVDLGRVPGNDDKWIGTADAWRRHHRVHAHVTSRARDCDGEYHRGHTDVPTTVERCTSYGDMDFKHRVIASVVSVFAQHATLVVTPERVEWLETTEEGFTETTIDWCEDDCADGVASWQRDLSAEAAGY